MMIAFYKYFLSRVDGQSSRYTGDDGLGESNVCPGRKHRQSAINPPNGCNFLIYMI